MFIEPTMEKEGGGDANAAEKKAKIKSVILPFVQGGLAALLTSVPWLGFSSLYKVAPPQLPPKELALFHFINKVPPSSSILYGVVLRFKV